MNQAPKAVGLRFNFYRDGLGVSLVINVILGIAVLVLLLIVKSLSSRPPDVKYFAVSDKGTLTPIVPLSQPHKSTSAILQWSSRCVSDAYSFDAENYRKEMTRVSECFTPDGHESFVASMQEQIKFVVDNVLIATAVPAETPVLIDEKDLPGGYAWKIRVPMQITLRNQTKSLPIKRLVTLIVVRRPTHENPDGIGISSLTAKDM